MSIETIEAEKDKKLVMDPKGFFVIFVDKKRKEVVVEFYEGKTKGDKKKIDTGKLKAVVCGRDAEALCHTIVREKLVSRLKHAAYLGREIQKAATSLNLKKKYTQDEPL